MTAADGLPSWPAFVGLPYDCSATKAPLHQKLWSVARVLAAADPPFLIGRSPAQRTIGRGVHVIGTVAVQLPHGAALVAAGPPGAALARTTTAVPPAGGALSSC